MKKMKRLEAFVSELTKSVKSSIREKQVENLLAKSQLSIENELATVDEELDEKVKKIATGDAKNLEQYLQELADLLQSKDDLNDSLALNQRVKDYLNEEIEVDEKQEKK